MAVGFRKRVRGTARQIGKAFPVFTKRKLPTKFGGKRRLKPKDTIVLQFEYPDEAEAFRDAYYAVGAVSDFPAPEDEKVVKNTVILRFDKEIIEDNPDLADDTLEYLKRASFFTVKPKKVWTA
jgi:hypothetical protein